MLSTKTSYLIDRDPKSSAGQLLFSSRLCRSIEPDCIKNDFDHLAELARLLSSIGIIGMIGKGTNGHSVFVDGQLENGSIRKVLFNTG